MSRLEEEELDIKSHDARRVERQGVQDKIKDDPGPGEATEAQESEVSAGGKSHHKDGPGMD